MSATRPHSIRVAAVAAAASLLLVGCSVDSLLERGLSMVEGVEGVEIDREDGSFAIRSEDGERFSIDIDEEEGTASFATQDGSVTTGQTSELPAEIAAVFTPPPAFEVQAVSDMSSVEDGRGLLAQGPISGEWQALWEGIAAAVETGPWDEVQRQVVQAGAMGTVIGGLADGQGTLTVTLTMEEDSEEGMLSILLVTPPADTDKD